MPSFVTRDWEVASDRKLETLLHNWSYPKHSCRVVAASVVNKMRTGLPKAPRQQRRRRSRSCCRQLLESCGLEDPMLAMPRSSTSASSNSRPVMVTLLLASLLLLGLFFVTKSSRSASNELLSDRASSGSIMAATTTKSSAIGVEEGQVGGIDYYRCSRVARASGARKGDANVSNRKAKTLLLFHGAAFTKKNWKESGILKRLCSLDNGDETPGGAQVKDDADSTSTLDVYAFDLPVSATAHDLKSLLDALHRQGAISLPVDAIVTPSASGKMVVEWDPTQDASLPALSSYASLWMPIASPAVASVQHPDQQFPQQFKNVRVVPVYGDQDAAGKRTMTTLATNVPGSDLVELSGRHPCYLDSPNDFVRLVLDRLAVL